MRCGLENHPASRRLDSEHPGKALVVNVDRDALGVWRAARTAVQGDVERDRFHQRSLERPERAQEGRWTRPGARHDVSLTPIPGSPGAAQGTEGIPPRTSLADRRDADDGIPIPGCDHGRGRYAG